MVLFNENEREIWPTGFFRSRFSILGQAPSPPAPGEGIKNPKFDLIIKMLQLHRHSGIPSGAQLDCRKPVHMDVLPVCHPCRDDDF